MNALANEDVGRYFKNNFVSSFQKVGTFKVVNGQKQGGNVASYFALPDGSVLHVVAGPVNANVLLKEARWVVETRKLALTDAKGDLARYKAFFRKAHAERLQSEHGQVARTGKGSQAIVLESFSAQELRRLGNDKQGQVHLLLASVSMPKADQIYRLVFEKILGEKVSTAPVNELGS